MSKASSLTGLVSSNRKQQPGARGTEAPSTTKLLKFPIYVESSDFSGLTVPILSGKGLGFVTSRGYEQKTKTVLSNDDREIPLELTAIMPHLRSNAEAERNYQRKYSNVIVVYDGSDKKSFDDAKRIIGEIQAYGSQRMVMLVELSMNDYSEPVVDLSEAVEFVTKMSIPLYQVDLTGQDNRKWSYDDFHQSIGQELLSSHIIKVTETILAELGRKTAEIKIPKALKNATALLNKLVPMFDDFAKNMKDSSLDMKVTKKEFLQQCNDTIMQALPQLEKDLGWGDYLINILKRLGNALGSVVTLGNQSNFFSVKKSESGRVAKETLNDLGAFSLNDTGPKPK